MKRMREVVTGIFFFPCTLDVVAALEGTSPEITSVNTTKRPVKLYFLRKGRKEDHDEAMKIKSCEKKCR